MTIRLVLLTASHLAELLRGIDNTGWLGNGNCVWHRKERVKRVTEMEEKRELERERGIEAWRAAALYHPILAHYTMYRGLFPPLLHGNYFPAQR